MSKHSDWTLELAKFVISKILLFSTIAIIVIVLGIVWITRGGKVSYEESNKTVVETEISK